MAVSGTGTNWNLPNYAGELFTADATTTPLLSMIGGLTGGKKTTNFEFPTSVDYAFPAAAQPAITETASITAPTAVEIARGQIKNVTQIFQEKISLTYSKMSNSGRLSGINTAGSANPAADEKAWQIAQALKKIARDVEFTFINGSYQIATSAAVANKTRGLIEATSLSGGSTIDATKAVLSKALLDQLFKTMAENGAYFDNMVLYANAKQKQAITNLYATAYNATMAPGTRAGMAVSEIETDFGRVAIVYDRFVPTDAIVMADIAHIAPVFQEVPGKGILFEEPLAKTGASEDIQIYGEIGLDHGAPYLHGSITNLG